MVDTAPSSPTLRSLAKADRRQALLVAAASLFARSGFNGVSIEDLGAAVGVSGPAVYRHFSGKQAVLAALLVGASQDLVTGGQAVVDETPDAAAALRSLVRFHVNFALSNPDVIRVQDRDLDSLADSERHRVRALQRAYVELWVQVLSRVFPTVDSALLRIRAHATFGLINSTPHSAARSAAKGGSPSSGGPSSGSPSSGSRLARTLPVPTRGAVRTLLEEMALTALTPVDQH